MQGSTSDTIARICRDLGLPPGDAYTQDWAHELPDEFRTYEFFSRYAAAYSTPGYGDAEKHLLMELMLDVTNDLLQEDEAVGYRVWNTLVNLVRTNPELHREQVEYWVLPGEPLEDAFRLTPLARSLHQQLFCS